MLLLPRVSLQASYVDYGHADRCFIDSPYASVRVCTAGELTNLPLLVCLLAVCIQPLCADSSVRTGLQAQTLGLTDLSCGEVVKQYESNNDGSSDLVR